MRLRLLTVASSAAVVPAACGTTALSRGTSTGANASPGSNGSRALGASGGGTADTIGYYFGPSQHDGAAYYRDYDLSDSFCCMQYTSGNKVAVGEGES